MVMKQSSTDDFLFVSDYDKTVMNQTNQKNFKHTWNPYTKKCSLKHDVLLVSNDEKKVTVSKFEAKKCQVQIVLKKMYVFGFKSDFLYEGADLA